MGDRGIIFSGPMVVALLAGRKTQTRRIIKPQPITPVERPLRHPPKHQGPYFDSYCGEKKTDKNPRGMSNRWCWWTADDRPDPLSEIRCPYGAPGDRLWVREGFAYSIKDGDGLEDGAPFAQETHDVVYRATSEHTGEWEHYEFDEHGNRTGTRIKPPWRPSIYMPRWASRIELEVTEVRAQRLHDITEDDAVAEGVGVYESQDGIEQTAREVYAAGWDTINGDGSWESNPLVWAITFRRSDG